MRKLYVTGICTLALTALFVFSSSVGRAGEVLKITPPVAQKINSAKSYSEWKNAMVGAAEMRVQKIKLTLEQQRQASGVNTDPNLRNQLSKEQLQATLATELTISDYFVGYLNKQSNMQDAIKSVAGKLSADEVAELMSAYAYNFNKNMMQPLKSASDPAVKGSFE
jgi:hypothetical protein